MRKVQIGELDNGMRVYTVPTEVHHTSNIVVKAGSLHDPPNLSGICHLAEHMSCRKTKRLNPKQFDLVLRKHCGGPDDDINVRTTRSNTNYGHEDLLSYKDMEEMFDLFASALKDRVLTQEGFDIERAAVYQEFFLRGHDVPEGLIEDLLHGVMYDRNPVRTRIDCSLTDLRGNITLDKTRGFIRRFYVPKNMFTVFFGPNLDYAMKITDRYFGNWGATSTPRFDYDHSENMPQIRTVKTLELPRAGIGQYHLAIGFPLPPGKDSISMEIMKHIIEMEMMWAMREDNREYGSGAYRALCYTAGTPCNAMIYLWTSSTNRDFILGSEKKMLRILKEMREGLVPEEYMDAVKHNLLHSFRNDIQYVSTNASERIISAVSCGDTDLVDFHQYRERVNNMSRRKLREATNRYLTPEGYARVFIIPSPQADLDTEFSGMQTYRGRQCRFRKMMQV